MARRDLTRRGPHSDERARILVTGGAGFIGSALLRRLSDDPAPELLVVDTLTYAASIDAIAAACHTGR